MSLKDKRVLFSNCLATLVLWINGQKGWEVAFDEGKVFEQRKSRWRIPFQDGVHISGSFHYQGLACDLLLYVDGVYVSDGGSPIWKEIGKKWESYHPSCTWGGRWNDANHFSLGEGTQQPPLT